MEKEKSFFTEAKARRFQLWAIEKGFCTDYYRYVAGGGLVYIVRYWK